MLQKGVIYELFLNDKDIWVREDTIGYVKHYRSLKFGRVRLDCGVGGRMMSIIS